ncbi:kinase-like domain-containing protein [Aspergillus egyptiacus]|nr:kinase-like domain-containing protein [Aspergillus egyptiacus]
MSESSLPPVKDTWLRRSLTLLAIKLCKRFRTRLSQVLFLTDRLCVKHGPFQHLSEAHAMQFIGANTSIPVPKVHCAFTRKGKTYIVMSRLSGSPIAHGWSKRSDESKARLLEQLRGYVEEMRALSPPASPSGSRFPVQGLGGSKLYDSRIFNGVRGFGPFESIQEFHSFLTGGIETPPDQLPEVAELFSMYRASSSRYGTCYTHGDLSSANILVRGDRVVGIVDWDTSGWYPEYWEYTMACNVNTYNEFWREEVDHFLQAYPEALEMERIRQKYFSDF